MNLSPHFLLAEFTASNTAAARGIDNTPPPEALANLRRLAEVLEQARAVLGGAIAISSGYRSPALNKAVGGSATSAHMDGRAADFTCPSFGEPVEVCRALVAAGIVVDQIISERSGARTWVHLGIARAGVAPRRQAFSIHNGRTLGGLQ